jgi:hypothetical protein
MATTVIACRVSTHLFRNTSAQLTMVYFFGTAAAEMVGAAGLLRLAGVTGWPEQSVVLMLIPIAYAVAAYAYRGSTYAIAVLRAGQAATFIMLLSGIGTALEALDNPVSGQPLNLYLAGFCAEAAVFFLLTARLHDRVEGGPLAVVLFCGAVWQVLKYFQVHDDEYYLLTFALLGLALVTAYRLKGFGRGAFVGGNALLTVAFVGAGLLGIQRLGFSEVRWLFVGLCAAQALIALAAAGLVAESGLRRWYVVAAVGQGLLTLLALQAMIHLSAWQKAELFLTAAGLMLLVVGHLGWHREREGEGDLVSFSLFLGSVLAAAPVAIAVVYWRSGAQFSWPDELGLLAAALGLLATGVLFRIRATTLVGTTALAVDLVTLALLARVLLPEHVKTTALMLAAGGGLLFGTGVVLAVFRDRLMELPDKVRAREGVFRVLSWR